MYGPVTQLLQDYADRGIIQNLELERAAQESIQYRFRWIYKHVFVLRVDAQSRRVSAVDLLPQIPYRSFMDRELRAFLKGRCAASLPEHRRIDPEMAEIKCVSRKGTVSLQLAFREADQLVWATQKMINLINELFHSFLSGPYHEYMVVHFHVAEE